MAVLAPPRPKSYDETFFRPITLWLTTTDHKLIGIMYIVTGLTSFLVGGVFAELVRIQLAQPNQHLLSDEMYNQVFSAHATTMIFFAIIPMLTGVGNYVVPLMVGARDMAFPRLNLLGFWVVPVAIVIYYLGFLFSGQTGGAMNAGWTGYPPLTELKFSPGPGTDLWALSLSLFGVGSIMAATNFITTVLGLRAPGMTITRLPMMAWGLVSTSILLLLATPSLTAALILLFFDRQYGTHFFTTTDGRPVLFQHMFWFYSHPAVYIMILPGFALVSEIVQTFSRKALFGYTSMVIAFFSIVFLSLAVWAHHMYTVGMNIWVETFFMIATALIAVPTGIKFFNWIATLWGGSIEFRVPMLYTMGFLATFLIGGITGVYLSSVPVDTQVHGSYYVVAHIHYVLVGGSVFTIFAGMHYWYPKVVGRMLDERIGKFTFWTFFIGFNGTFLIQHVLGLTGMPRRVASYVISPGHEDWGWMNLTSTLFSFLIVTSVAVFVYNLIRSARHGEIAGNNPWGGVTLEWATTSPPPPYNFDHVPVVRSRRPLLELKAPLSEVPTTAAAPAPAPAPGG